MSYLNRTYYQHLITPRTVTVVFSEGDPISIVRSDNNAARFDNVVMLLRGGHYNRIPSAVDRALQIDVVSKGKFTMQNGCIMIDGQDLPNTLSDKLFDLVDEEGDTTSLENFWDNLKDNPTESSREDLYSFLDYNNVPITLDGCFIVYKKVNDDFWDSYTGRTHQSIIGSVIEMPREKVDQNRNNTCSTGLHVAAYEYATGFSGTRLLECKVNPRDVVAVPPDYSNQKMRVCRYEVLREATGKFVEPVYTEESPTTRLGGGVFKPLRLTLDSRGRLRVPGAAIRRLGCGVGALVVALVTTGSSRFIRLQEVGATMPDWHKAHREYTVDKDNSIRLSPEMLSEAKLDDYEEYVVRLKGNTLEIRVD